MEQPETTTYDEGKYAPLPDFNEDLNSDYPNQNAAGVDDLPAELFEHSGDKVHLSDSLQNMVN